MRSPGQFTHPLIVRAKCEIAAAALGNGIVPSHNVTTEFRDAAVVADDARRARLEFGYLRMWSIHPNQIQPIVEAMRPDFAEVDRGRRDSARRPGCRLGADLNAKVGCMTARPIAITGNSCNGHGHRHDRRRASASRFFALTNI